ncbi:MAG: 3-hydroxyacyl-ACP dehydratase FabZ [Nitrospinota bacterium]
MLSLEQIKEYLPHREPFLMIDRIVEIEAGKRAVGKRKVRADEYFFAGHFPGNPVFPGVLTIEALAQAAVVLAKYKRDNQEDNIYYLASVDKVRFKQIVNPGDELTLTITALKARNRFCKVAGVATVDGEIVCQAELSSFCK